MISTVATQNIISSEYDIKTFLGKGWHGVEADGVIEYAWSKKEAFLDFSQNLKGFSLYFYGGSRTKFISIYDSERGLIGNYIVGEIVKDIKILPPTKKVKIVVSNPRRASFNDKRSLGVMLQRISPLEMYREICRVPPTFFWIEPTRLCNMNPSCVMCDSVQGETHISEKILNNISPYLKTAGAIWFHGKGEPLLCKTLFNILDSADPKRTYTMFNTNGLLLTKRMSERLIAKRLKEINFSIDAATSETYGKIRSRGNFEKLKNNIKRLRKMKEQKKIQYPRILINIVLMRENINELTRFVILAHELGAQAVCTRLLKPINRNIIVRKPGFCFNYKEQMLDTRSDKFKDAILEGERKAIELRIEFRGEEFEIQRLLQKDSKNKIGGAIDVIPLCKKPWTEVLIDVDGGVKICCHMEPKDGVGDIRLGSLNSQTFEEIWNGPLVRKVRRYLINNVLPPECRTCPYHKNL